VVTVQTNKEHTTRPRSTKPATILQHNVVKKAEQNNSISALHAQKGTPLRYIASPRLNIPKKPPQNAARKQSYILLTGRKEQNRRFTQKQWQVHGVLSPRKVSSTAA